jgi:release factor glutamine methyltransferase
MNNDEGRLLPHRRMHSSLVNTTTQTDVLRKVESILARAGVPDPARDALAIVITARRLTDIANLAMCALAMADERAAGTPLGYVTGSVRFMDIELLTAPGALVPREQTELLGLTALNVLGSATARGELRVVDMCCGCGNLICGIASHHPGVRGWAVDLTEDAVRAARTNVDRLDLSHRVEVVQSDLFTSLRGRGLEGTIDVIVCNPPYISSGQLERRADLLMHEPRAAFDGGPYGVSIFQQVVRDAPAFLKHGGTLLFEIGDAQDRPVSLLFERSGLYEPVVPVRDQEGRARVIAGRTR